MSSIKTHTYSWKSIKDSSITKNSNDIYKNELDQIIRVIYY